MKILVIDHEPIVRSTLLEFLQDAGHKVAAIENPNALQATTALTEFDADVVLTETQQPASIAQARIDEIARRFPRATIYEMDNSPGIHNSQTSQSTSAGVDGRLRKPIRLAELEIVLKNLEMFDSPHAKGPVRHRRAAAGNWDKAQSSEGNKP